MCIKLVNKEEKKKNDWVVRTREFIINEVKQRLLYTKNNYNSKSKLLNFYEWYPENFVKENNNKHISDACC